MLSDDKLWSGLGISGKELVFLKIQRRREEGQHHCAEESSQLCGHLTQTQKYFHLAKSWSVFTLWTGPGCILEHKLFPTQESPSAGPCPTPHPGLPQGLGPLLPWRFGAAAC